MTSPSIQVDAQEYEAEAQMNLTLFGLLAGASGTLLVLGYWALRVVGRVLVEFLLTHTPKVLEGLL